MITIFTIPKPFFGHNALIQLNAIRSWLQLNCKSEIIILGDDAGVSETAQSLGVKHISFVHKNEFGTPLLNSAFDSVQKTAENDIIMYANSDIIIFQNLVDVIKPIITTMPSFLICGRRWDLDVNYEISFVKDDWGNDLRRRLNAAGRLHSLSGMDYFIFRRNTINMLPFAVGRPGWDTWLIYEMRRAKVPVIDASGAIEIVHQNHDYSHSKFGESNRVGGPEWRRNIRVAGGLTKMLTLRDADWVLTKDGLRRPHAVRRVLSTISTFYLWRALLATKRLLQRIIRNTRTLCGH